MSIFKKIFGKKEQKSSARESSEWDFYFSNVDDVVGSFFVDLGLIHTAPVSDKPNFLRIAVTMNNPREDGLSSGEEFEILKRLEDKLTHFIIAKHNAVFAGRLTTNGRRDFYFYLSNTKQYDKTIATAMKAFPTYKFDVVLRDDQKWEEYINFLYPHPGQYQSILNRRVVYSLEQRGDHLTKARPVDHWIYFKTEADKEKFLSDTQDDGFTIVDNDYNVEFGEAPYRLRISRIDKVDFDSVDDYALRLWSLAQECNGVYDGWETSVERE
jgi:uncharacterized protein (TIGR01619 family)